METYLKAGIAIYNAGEFHAAHDAWEDHWLNLEKDTSDERFLHGLIQFTAAIYHGTTRNWEGLHGLATSALEYLESHPDTYRKVALKPIRVYLEKLANDPEHIERQSPPLIRYDGSPITLEDLDIESSFIVAAILAEEYEQFDLAVIEKAIVNAQTAIQENTTSKHIALLNDFVTQPDHRQLIYERLSSLISRQTQRDQDVAGLFDE